MNGLRSIVYSISPSSTFTCYKNNTGYLNTNSLSSAKRAEFSQMTNCEWLEEVHLTAAAYKMEKFVTFVSEICESSSATITSLTLKLFNGIISCYTAVNVTET